MILTEQTYKALEYNKVLELLANFAKTKGSKEICLNLTPENNREVIERSLNFTDEARRILDFAMDIPIEYVIDLKGININAEYFM